jgi:hypothetical protein
MNCMNQNHPESKHSENLRFESFGVVVCILLLHNECVGHVHGWGGTGSGCVFFCVCIPCRQSRHTQNSLAGRIPLNKVLSLVWQEFDIYWPRKILFANRGMKKMSMNQHDFALSHHIIAIVHLESDRCPTVVFLVPGLWEAHDCCHILYDWIIITVGWGGVAPPARCYTVHLQLRTCLMLHMHTCCLLLYCMFMLDATLPFACKCAQAGCYATVYFHLHLHTCWMLR